MTLITPNLDDRKFQDIVSEARSKIPLYCPKWTDYNLSDPGITLIELFAWMVDMLLYRLNRVPDKNYIKFMEIIGIHLEPPSPAMVDVTFRLSAPQLETITIPQGTEVATVRTETQEAVSFTTNGDLVIVVPHLAYALTTTDESAFNDCLPTIKNPDLLVDIFQQPPAENDAFYLGCDEDLKAHTLMLSLECSVEGIGVDPYNPPLVWEYWNGELEQWSALVLESDTTGGLNADGQVILRIPGNCDMTEVNGINACWIRCRAIQPQPGQRPYSTSPRVKTVAMESIGGTVAASHAFKVLSEFLGISDGSSGQRFQLQNTPVLLRENGETIEVEEETEGEFQPWQEVTDFSSSGPDDAHFTCDSVSGEIQFGVSIRKPSGEEWQYGKVPPDGRRIRFTAYRCGGGVEGNVGEGTITVLKSSIPYVASVNNYSPARGGTDAETMDSAKIRAPQVLKSSTRAVTAEDFESLALEASPAVARARCICPGSTSEGTAPPPGLVKLYLVPAVQEAARLLSDDELRLTRRVQEEVQYYLDERRLLAVRLETASATYVPVSVTARIKVRPGRDPEQVAASVEQELYRYINPVCGGSEGSGWEFGRSLSVSEIYAVMQSVDGLDYIEEVKLFPVDADTGERQEPVTKLGITPESVFCSREHQVLLE
ncbi:MAG: putative baseplate assembly protein [Dehalococcoidales bacterium]|nr:MAG: putative baseplate assembly protein [Dehalococcoidales bacterium]